MIEHDPIDNEANDGAHEEMDEVIVRPARPEDRDAVLAFCAHTWDGGDYIAEVWEKWLADSNGALLIAVVSGKPVGLIHLDMLSPEEAWIEGIRVDPAQRRQGIGRILTSQALVAARERGAKVARLITDSDNIASQALVSKKFGFQRMAEVARYEAPALESGVDEDADLLLASEETDIASNVQEMQEPRNENMREEETNEQGEPAGPHLLLAGAEDYERIQAWLAQSNLAPFNGGLQFGWWRAWALTEQSMRDYLAEGAVWLLEEWDTIQAIAIIHAVISEELPPEMLQVRYIDGAAGSISMLALALREIAQEHGLPKVELWLPELLILRDAMNGAGYSRDGEETMLVYARNL